ncbi:uncharacterized protein [Medicago truncatula]|nr:uncharacterized protein LOC112416397 isoform X3 [Medicago truncatula]
MRVANVVFIIFSKDLHDVVLLPPLLVADFGNDINHYATLIDPCNNQFDVAVEKGKGSIYAKPKDCSLCVISMISVSVLGSLWYMLGWKLVYNGFCESALDKRTTALVLIDDCGNKWNCTLFLGSISYCHRKIAGEWKKMIAAHRICEVAQIKSGALMVGKNEIVYLEFIPILCLCMLLFCVQVTFQGLCEVNMKNRANTRRISFGKFVLLLINLHIQQVLTTSNRHHGC